MSRETCSVEATHSVGDRTDEHRRALLMSFQPPGRPRFEEAELRPDLVHLLPRTERRASCITATEKRPWTLGPGTATLLPRRSRRSRKKAAESGSPMVDNVLDATGLEGSSVAGSAPSSTESTFVSRGCQCVSEEGSDELMEGSMPYATWNGAILAESDDVVVVDGKTYFPKQAVAMEYLEPNDDRSVCSWKGTAEYFDVVVDGEVNADAAWRYSDPSTKASMVADRIAFWRGVQIESDRELRSNARPRTGGRRT